MINDNDNPDQQTEGLCETDIDEAKTPDDSWELALFFGVVIVILLSLLAWPWPYRVINDLWGPTEREYLGTVQRITYVGGFGADTQIDTETRTFLLSGPALILKGTRLERRQRIFDSEVCDMDTDACRDLIGH